MIECNWCHQKVEEDDAHEVTFLGRRYFLCEEDFQLIWRGLSGVNALCKQLKAAISAGR